MYRQRTKLLGLPVIGLNDRIQPDLELQKYQIIENLLVAGTQGVKNCVFDDGTFRLDRETDETFYVSLSATGHSPSAHGIVGGAYFFAQSRIKWEGLAKGYIYWLYLRGNPKTFEIPSEVRTIASQYPLEGDVVLLAKVDLSSDPPSLDANPDGKIYSEDLARHISDCENPHGRTLHQDEVVVRNRLVLHDDGSEAEVEMLKDGQPVSIPASAFAGAAAELAGRRVEFMDIESPGGTGRLVEVAGVGIVRFVSASNSRGASPVQVGDITIGYHGIDPNVNLPNEFMIYNDGAAGASLRLMIFCG